MNKIQILAIGHNEEILQTVLRLINANTEWEGTGTTNDEKAIELFHHRKFDIVLLGGGINSQDEMKLRTLFVKQNPQITIIQHFGGGSGFLANEIQAALEKNADGNFNVIDNPFR
jgi:hypothetical protein